MKAYSMKNVLYLSYVSKTITETAIYDWNEAQKYYDPARYPEIQWSGQHFVHGIMLSCALREKGP